MTLKQHIRYDVLAEPSPEYLAGLPGRNGIYTVVKLVDDLPPEIVKVFDGFPSSQSREAAYAHARELNEIRRQELETLVLVPFIEDLKTLSIADAAEVDRLRAENEALRARQITPDMQSIWDEYQAMISEAQRTDTIVYPEERDRLRRDLWAVFSRLMGDRA